MEQRWLRWIGPGLVALGAVGAIATTTLGAGDRPWAPRACAGPATGLPAALRQPMPAGLADLRSEPWYRLDPVLDGAGALRGQRLATGVGGRRVAPAAELPNELFVGGPFGRVLLVGTDDGTGSRLEAFDVASGCAWHVATEPDVIRRATIDPTTATLYETRVDRATRADLGVWHRPLGAVAPAVRVLAPLPPDERFGRTFSTEFAWDTAGDRLAVQSCGELSCRTRFVTAPGAGTLDDPDLGPLVGFADDLVVTYGACRGMPCPIVASDLATGQRRVIEAFGGPAVVVATPDGPRLVHEVRDSHGRRLRATSLDAFATVDVGPVPDGLAVMPLGTRTGSAMRLPVGWYLLAPDGRLPVDPSNSPAELRRILDGSAVGADEVLR